MQIEDYILKLLKENDCVVLPDFGAFVANYRIADIDQLTNQFSPPSSTVGFNPNIKTDDGLLTKYISSSEGLKYQEVQDQMASYVLMLNEGIRNGETIELNGLGIFYLNLSGNISFEPNLTENLLVDSFGLRKFHFKKLPVEQNNGQNDTAVVINIDQSSVKTFRRIAAVFALVTFSYFVLLWLNNNRVISSKTLASINPFHNSYSINYLPRKNASQVVFEDLMELSVIDSTNKESNLGYVEIESDQSTTSFAMRFKDVTLKQDSTFVKLPTAPKANRFFIVAGVFGNFENAENLVRSLKSQGYKSDMMPTQNGMYRVTFQAYGFKRDAINDLIVIKKTNPGAWIYTAP
ncbi:MAG: SPOR domain-containing protein [Flavobacteriales bacterium]|nr:SPOR domain-containing protein [Flavobacteriales bacterium]